MRVAVLVAPAGHRLGDAARARAAADPEVEQRVPGEGGTGDHEEQDPGHPDELTADALVLQKCGDILLPERGPPAGGQDRGGPLHREPEDRQQDARQRQRQQPDLQRVRGATAVLVSAQQDPDEQASCGEEVQGHQHVAGVGEQGQLERAGQVVEGDEAAGEQRRSRNGVAEQAERT